MVNMKKSFKVSKIIVPYFILLVLGTLLPFYFSTIGGDMSEVGLLLAFVFNPIGVIFLFGILFGTMTWSIGLPFAFFIFSITQIPMTFIYLWIAKKLNIKW